VYIICMSEIDVPCIYASKILNTLLNHIFLNSVNITTILLYNMMFEKQKT